jgi:tetratricopeptide (TPR) repeat protein
MKKIIMIVCSALGILITSIPLLPSPEGKMNILVYPFNYEGSAEYSWIAAGLTDTVISDLNRIRDVSVFSEEDRKRAMREMELGMTGLFDERTVVKVGGLVGANVIFTGSIQIIGERVRIIAKLMNTVTTRVEKTIKLDGALNGLFDLQDKVVLGLMVESEKMILADIRPVVVSDDDKKKISAKYKPTGEAYEWFAKGLAVLDSDPKSALGFFRKAWEIDGQYVDALREAGIVAVQELNLFDEGKEYLVKAEQILAQRGETETVAYADLMRSTALIYYHRGDLNAALDWYAREKGLRERLGMQKTAVYARLIMRFGMAYDTKGNQTAALEYYSKSREILEALGIQNTLSYASLMNNIAIIFKARKQPDAALEYYMKTKRIMEGFGKQGTSDYAALLNNIGLVYKDKEDYAAASEHIMKAKEILDALGLRDTDRYAGLMTSLGIMCWKRSELESSLAFFMKADEIRNRMGLQKTVLHADNLYWIGLILEKQGKGDSAGKYYRKAYAVYDAAGFSGEIKDKADRNARRLGY